jgi:hypothetical protein
MSYAQYYRHYLDMIKEYSLNIYSIKPFVDFNVKNDIRNFWRLSIQYKFV